MEDIARFTKQTIPVVVVEGFGPEAGERAEPIAMGRQTIWGGAGKPPSRDVMQAAAKAARTEMLTRVRENKAGSGGQGAGRGNGGGGGGGRGGQRATGGGAGGQGQRANGGGGGFGGRNGGGAPRDNDRDGEFQPPRPQGARPPQGRGRGPGGPARAQPAGFANEPRADRPPAGQPDPMRTSVDMMAERGARRGGYGGGGGGGNRGGNGGGNGGSGNGGGNGGGSRSGGYGGGGNGSRGTGNPRGPFSR